jgi:hypothetical protein
LGWPARPARRRLSSFVIVLSASVILPSYRTKREQQQGKIQSSVTVR